MRFIINLFIIFMFATTTVAAGVHAHEHVDTTSKQCCACLVSANGIKKCISLYAINFKPLDTSTYLVIRFENLIAVLFNLELSIPSARGPPSLV